MPRLRIQSLWEILRFEVRYRLRRPSTWIFFGVVLGLTYMVTSGSLVDEATRAGDLHANGPTGIAFANILISMFGLVITAALFSGAALRTSKRGCTRCSRRCPSRRRTT